MHMASKCLRFFWVCEEKWCVLLLSLIPSADQLLSPSRVPGFLRLRLHRSHKSLIQWDSLTLVVHLWITKFSFAEKPQAAASKPNIKSYTKEFQNKHWGDITRIMYILIKHVWVQLGIKFYVVIHIYWKHDTTPKNSGLSEAKLHIRPPFQRAQPRLYLFQW